MSGGVVDVAYALHPEIVRNILDAYYRDVSIAEISNLLKVSESVVTCIVRKAEREKMRINLRLPK